MKKVIALIGKSASGKDTIAQELLRRVPNSSPIVSYTTRPRRENEIDGYHYHFITNDELQDKIAAGEMYEVSWFNGWGYGTAADSYKDNTINIGVFNIDGAYDLYCADDIDVKIYYINVSDKQRLLRQLQRESSPDIHEIIRRFGTDEDDFQDYNMQDFPYIELHNEDADDFENAIQYIIEDNLL